jgi:hypothetical protein
VVEIYRSCELESSQVEDPSISHSRSRVAKLQEDKIHPSEEDRCQISKGLANSGVHRVKFHVLGITSYEDASGERRTAVGSRT